MDFPVAFSKPIQGDKNLSACTEVISGELFRYFVGLNQPKTRLVVDETDDNISIASKEIPNFRVAEDKDLQSYRPGLAGSLLLSYFLQEWDAKSSNFFVSGETIGRFDFEWCFFPLRNAASNARFSVGDWENFPIIRDFKPGFWPHLPKLSTSTAFQKEKHLMMLKILITPNQIIDDIISSSAANPRFTLDREAIHQKYYEFLAASKNQCLKSGQFCSFIKGSGKKNLEKIICSVKEYILVIIFFGIRVFKTPTNLIFDFNGR